MVIDDLFGVVHTAVTDFYGVAVKYFAEDVILREMFLSLIDKHFVCIYSSSIPQFRKQTFLSLIVCRLG